MGLFERGISTALCVMSIAAGVLLAVLGFGGSYGSDSAWLIFGALIFITVPAVMLFAMYGGFGMKLCGGCRYAEYAYSGVGLLTDAPKPRHATADDFARDESDIRWGRGLLEYAAETDENGICLCFPDGALACGEKQEDMLTLSFSQGLCGEHLSALCRDTACGTVKMRLKGDDIPYLMGYNLPFENLHIDFIFD